MLSDVKRHEESRIRLDFLLLGLLPGEDIRLETGLDQQALSRLPGSNLGITIHCV